MWYILNNYITFDGIVYKYFENGVVAFNSADTGLTKIRIPETVYNKPVLGVAQTAFMLEDSLAEIQLPESIKFIGKQAFDGCEKLVKVVLYPVKNFQQKVVLRIEEKAFYQCHQLKEFRGKHRIVEIQPEAFAECQMLQKFNCPIQGNPTTNGGHPRKLLGLKKIPIIVQELNAYAFQWNTVLSELTFHGFSRLKKFSLKETNISTLTIPNIAIIDDEVLAHIKKNNIKIRCRDDSRLINLAFEGYWIEVFD